MSGAIPLLLLCAFLAWHREQLYLSACTSVFFMLCVSCTIILPVVLYGCETWSLILREESRLRVFENRVLRIFGPKRDEVTEE